MAAQKIIIAGGTGNLGKALVEWFSAKGDNCIVLTRRAIKPTTNSKVNYIQWNPEHTGKWGEVLEGSDLLINVCGARISDSNFEGFKASRITPTRALVKAINSCVNPPKVFISASSVNIYPNDTGEIFNEKSAIGNSKYAILCKEWEEAAKGINTDKCTVYLARIGTVITRDSIYTSFAELVKKGVMFNLPDFYINYISSNDFSKAMEFIATSRQPTYSAFNVCITKPVLYSELIATLKDIYGKKSLMKVPGIISKLAFRLKGIDPLFFEENKQVHPELLKNLGFVFSDKDFKTRLQKLFTNGEYK
jgi:uncharacterized protein (TIGR01777 family)